MILAIAVLLGVVCARLQRRKPPVFDDDLLNAPPPIPRSPLDEDDDGWDNHDLDCNCPNSCPQETEYQLCYLNVVELKEKDTSCRLEWYRLEDEMESCAGTAQSLYQEMSSLKEQKEAVFGKTLFQVQQCSHGCEDDSNVDCFNRRILCYDEDNWEVMKRDCPATCGYDCGYLENEYYQNLCSDYDDECEDWRKKNWCWKDHGYNTYMQEKCSRTCGYCGSGTKYYEIDSCVNEWSYDLCIERVKKGLCSYESEYKEFMKTNCRMSCGYCGNGEKYYEKTIEETTCNNLYGDSTCNGYAQSDGYCSTSVDWMKTNCYKACGYCGGGTKYYEQSSSSSSGSCEDKYSTEECSGWKTEGYCTARAVAWMKENCHKTCGYCEGSSSGSSSSSSSSCSDKYTSSECSGWKTEGYCTARAVEWMKENCHKTCGYCNDDDDDSLFTKQCEAYQCESGCSMRYDIAIYDCNENKRKYSERLRYCQENVNGLSGGCNGAEEVLRKQLEEVKTWDPTDPVGYRWKCAECVDISDWCKDYADYCFKEGYYESMRRNCPKTCGYYCRITTDAESASDSSIAYCKDKSPKEDCDYRKTNDLCDSSFAAENCKKTCEYECYSNEYVNFSTCKDVHETCATHPSGWLSRCDEQHSQESCPLLCGACIDETKVENMY